MKFRANGLEINYELDGPAGAPVVTLSHSIAADLTMWDATLPALRDLDFTERLSGIHLPTLLIVGEHDEATPPSPLSSCRRSSRTPSSRSCRAPPTSRTSSSRRRSTVP